MTPAKTLASLSLWVCVLATGCGSSSSGTSSTSLSAGSTAASTSGAAANTNPASTRVLRAVAVHSELWRGENPPAQPLIHVLVSGAPAAGLSLEIDRGQGFNDTGLVALDTAGYVEFRLPAARPPVGIRAVFGGARSNEIAVPSGGFAAGNTTILSPQGTYLDVTGTTRSEILGWDDVGASSYLVVVGEYRELQRTGLAIVAELTPEWVVEVEGNLRSWSAAQGEATSFLRSGVGLSRGLKGAVVYALDRSGWAVRHDTRASSQSPGGTVASSVFKFLYQ